MSWKLTHKPCKHCPSTDAASMNEDGWWTCFSCGVRWSEEGSYEQGETLNTKTSLVIPPAKAIPDRKLTKSTVETYGVGVVGKDHYYPSYNEKGQVVAVKVRKHPKEFSYRGKPIAKGMLFGQPKFQSGGKYITITEGALDAMAVYEMNGKFPAVAVESTTTALKQCTAQYEWLDSFDNIVIAFDNDDVGQEAAQQVAELFPGKAKIAHLGDYNDPCDILKQDSNPLDTWKKIFWSAELWTPDNIVAGDELWETLNTPVEVAPITYPWQGLNDLLYGIRFEEMVMLCAGSGLGKSAVVKEIVYHILNTTDFNVGMIMLEEGVRRTGQSLMSLHAEKQLHLPTTVSTEEERRAAFDATLGTGKVFLFDHFGSATLDNIVARIRYMVRALGCKVIVLDHITMMVSDGSMDNTVKQLDAIMTKLRTVVEETKVALIAVSHLSRPQGQGHENGAVTSLSQLRGSGGIGQLSDIVIGLERNSQAEDHTERNTTHVRVLKNRFSGDLGPCCNLLYNKKTGRLTQKGVHRVIEAEVL